MKTNPTRIVLLCIVWLCVALSLVQLATAVADAWQPAQFMMAPHAEEREALGGGLPWATINASNVNFRKGPGLNYDVCCQWSYGVAVEVIGEKNGWYECLHWTCPEHVWIWGEYLDFK